MFCKDCGKEIQETASFCQSCGMQIDITGQNPAQDKNSTKLNFRLIGKIGLLLVVFGFFMPIACNMNGFELAERMLSDNSHSNNQGGIFLYTLFMSALAGTVIGVLLLKRKNVPSIADWIVLLICTGSGIAAFAIFFGTDSYDLTLQGSRLQIRLAPGWYAELQSGFYIMLIGLIVALVAQILDDVAVPRETWQEPNYPPGYMPKNKKTALLFCIFLGWLAAHRFYVGRIKTGILMLAVSPLILGNLLTAMTADIETTGGTVEEAIGLLPLRLVWVIWWIVDMVRIYAGKLPISGIMLLTGKILSLLCV